MRQYSFFLLWLLAGCLTLWLILGFWASATGLLFSLLALILYSAGAIFWWRYQTGFQSQITPVSNDILPPENYQGIVVLACGDHSALFLADENDYETRQGWYLRVTTPEQLSILAQQIAIMRPALISQTVVLLAVVPEQHQSRQGLARSLRLWHRAITSCRHGLSGTLPLLLGIWVTPLLPDTKGIWLSDTTDHGAVQIMQPGQGSLPLETWCHEAPVSRETRFFVALWADSVSSWLKNVVIPVLTEQESGLPALTLCGWSCQFIAVNATENNLWQQHISEISGLAPAVSISNERVDLPDILLASLPHQREVSGGMRHWRLAGILFGGFLLMALLTSWMNNRKLLHSVGDHLMIYHQLTGLPPQPKIQAREQLRDDARLLDKWQRSGEPQRFSLGLYQGDRLLPSVRAALSDWTPPATEIKTVVQPPAAHTLRLNNLALFDPGKAQLRPGAEKALIHALTTIKSQIKPGWLIVVSGHTDSTGSSELNHHLSLNRAQSVRNWLRDNGFLAESCFAVQGFGAEHPLETNNTAQGRAANRRVEITLVPQAGNCQIPDNPPLVSPSGETSHEQK